VGICLYVPEIKMTAGQRVIYLHLLIVYIGCDVCVYARSGD
jgi:hypothetical protein